MGQNINQEIGGRVRAARLSRGFGLRRVADVMGISFQQLSMLERGRNSWSADRILGAAIAVGVTIRSLVPPAAARSGRRRRA